MSTIKEMNWMEHLGFEVQEAGGVPVINEEGDMREADLCHRVLWDEMVSIHAERDSLRAVNADLLETLEEITEDYSDRFDLDSPSTNPGIKSSIAKARAAIASARAMEGEKG